MLDLDHPKAKKSPQGPKSNGLHSDEYKLLTLQIEQALKYYKLAHSSVLKLENNIREFLNDYYFKVGKQFQQLVALHERIVHSSALHFSEDSVPLDDAYFRRHNNEWDGHLKSMYRKLIKSYHPDSTGQWRRENASAAARLNEINLAYSTKDVSTLLRLDLEHGCERLSDSKKNEFLHQRLASLQNEVRKLVDRKQFLKKSVSFQLMKKVQDAREHGVDLIAVIKEEVQEQIDRQMAFIWHNPMELLLEEEQLALMGNA